MVVSGSPAAGLLAPFENLMRLTSLIAARPGPWLLVPLLQALPFWLAEARLLGEGWFLLLLPVAFGLSSVPLRAMRQTEEGGRAEGLVDVSCMANLTLRSVLLLLGGWVPLLCSGWMLDSLLRGALGHSLLPLVQPLWGLGMLGLTSLLVYLVLGPACMALPALCLRRDGEETFGLAAGRHFADLRAFSLALSGFLGGAVLLALLAYAGPAWAAPLVVALGFDLWLGCMALEYLPGGASYLLLE